MPTLEMLRGNLPVQLLISKMPMSTVEPKQEMFLKLTSKKLFINELDLLKDYSVLEFQLLEFYPMAI